ncbi:MAG: ExbD/TolR family protein [Pseudomonadales bacterium]
MAKHIGRHANDDDEGEIDLTPMLDVVFIMLIFFIVTASFVKEVGLDVNRPEASEAPPNLDQKNIVLKITGSGEIWLADRRIDVRAVRANVERLIAENPKASVIVQANNKATTEVFAAVIDSAREAGVYNVSLTTSED